MLYVEKKSEWQYDSKTDRQTDTSGQRDDENKAGVGQKGRLIRKSHLICPRWMLNALIELCQPAADHRR